jgi:hypothetical protein
MDGGAPESRTWRSSSAIEYRGLSARHGENAGHGTSVQFTVRRQSAAPDVVRFEADIGAEFAPWRGLAGVQLDRASFIRDWTARVGACYGHVTDDANSSGTALEHKTGQPSW